MMATATDARSALDLRRAPLSSLHAIDFRAATRDFWADEAAALGSPVGILGRASTTPPGGCPARHRRTREARTGRCSITSAMCSTGTSSQSATSTRAEPAVGGRPTTTTTAATSTRSTKRRRPLFADLPPPEFAATAPRRPHRAARDGPPIAPCRRSTATRPGAGSTASSMATRSTTSASSSRGPTACAVARSRTTRSGRTRSPVPPTSRRRRPRFWADEASVSALSTGSSVSFLPMPGPNREVTPGWTVADHVGHLAAWFDETAAVLDEHRRTGTWRELPAEGIDAWNDERVQRARGTPDPRSD